ncbi:MAG: imelysin family protein [Chitinophagales bacterium]
MTLKLKTHIFLLIAILNGSLFMSCSDDISSDTLFDKQAMVDGYAEMITDAFNDLNTNIDDLKNLVVAFNQQSSLEDLETIQDQFLNTILAFQTARLFDIGPIKANLYMANMAQWPSKNTDIAQIISGSDIIDESYISQLGANQKGLHGIEYSLFQDQLDNQSIYNLFTNDEDAERRINYLKYSVQELQTICSAMQTLWLDTYKNEFSRALENGVNGAENRIYNQSVTVIDETINYIRLANDAFDMDAVDPNHDNLFLWNSQFTADAIGQLITTISTVFYNGSSPGLFDHLNFVKAQWEDGTMVANAIKYQLDSAQVILDEIDNMETGILTNDQNIELLEQALKDVLTLYRTDMASWLSLLLLVGDNDGD